MNIYVKYDIRFKATIYKHIGLGIGLQTFAEFGNALRNK